MSSTRTSANPDDFSAERGLSSPLISGINIGLNVIGRVARARTTEERRCMVWLHNYARLMQLTADALASDMGMSRFEIREALTDPACQHLTRFCSAVKSLRATYESNQPQLVKNRVSRCVRSGMEEAAEDRVCGIIIGPERVGKSEAFLDTYLREYMDRGILINCPEGRDMRSFITVLAAALGIHASRAKKNDHIRDQIMATFATGIIEILCIDEGQRIWPADLANHFPEKVEFIRTLWDNSEIQRRARRGRDGGGGLAIAVCATPQFGDDLNTAIGENRRWKPGQFEGRMRRSTTPDTLTSQEISSIARYMAPAFDDASIEQLTTVTLASPGLLGFLGNVIGKIQYKSRKENRHISPELIAESAREMLQGTTTEKRAKAAAAKAAGRALS